MRSLLTTAAIAIAVTVSLSVTFYAFLKVTL